VASLAEIRVALAVQIADAIDDLTPYHYMPMAPDVPAVAVLPRSWMYDETFDGAVTYQLEVWIYLNGADLEAAQLALDPYLAPSGVSSVAAAINADPDLGLTNVNVRATGANEYGRLLDVAGGKLFGGSINVEVFA
jgi:hypothetical protein